MRHLVLVLALLCLVANPAKAHEITFSHIDVHLERDQTFITAKLPIKALLQQEHPPFPKGTSDTTLRSSPYSAVLRGALEDLFIDRLRITTDGKSLALHLTAVEPSADDVEITASSGAATGALKFEANFFPDDALHKEFVTIYRAQTLVAQYALDRDNPDFTLAATERPLWQVIASFVNEGIHHIFIGPDHILFVLALILLGGSLWSQLKVITAFTIAHSITLALATLNVVELPSRLIESVIALSIIVVGVHDIIKLRQDTNATPKYDPRIAFAFVFGLVHGFGFASVLTEIDLPTNALAWSLAAFNIGVEIGQVTIVLLAIPLIRALHRYAPRRLAKRVLICGAVFVVIMGTYWFCQRAFDI